MISYRSEVVKFNTEINSIFNVQRSPLRYSLCLHLLLRLHTLQMKAL